MTEADIRGIFGDQRKGKSCLGVAFAVDDAIDKMVGIRFNGQYYKAQCLNDEELLALERNGIQAYKPTHCRIFSKDGRSKIIEMPKGAIIDTPVRIFANFHLYGIPYVYMDGMLLITYINTDLITNGWILMDESTMNDARDSMTREGKITAKFGAQAAKRGLHLCTIAQYYEQIERRYRLFKTTTIECIEYDKETHYITCNVKEKGEEQQQTEFYSPPYWRYYNTNEIIGVPQHQVDDAATKMNSR
jgi:hypothetical protein